MRALPIFLLVPLAAASALLTGITAGPAWGQATPRFFFALPGQTPSSFSQGVTSLTAGQGQNFTLSVWYQYQPTFSFTYTGINTLIGFDQTTIVGEGATPATNRVTFGSIGNVNPDLEALSPALGGGRDPIGQPSTAIRPYGVDAGFVAASGVSGFSGTGPTPVRLFDVTLRNAALATGATQQITIYTSGNPTDATAFDTFITDGDRTVLPDSTYVLTLTGGALAVPEPSAFALFGVCGLAWYIGRRRARRAVSG